MVSVTTAMMIDGADGANADENGVVTMVTTLVMVTVVEVVMRMVGMAD